MSGDLSLTPGASSYFSAPASHLDPNLFGPNEHMRSSVRSLITTTLYSYWRGKLSSPESWSTLYLAGSGASYQWDADRSESAGEPGDLDVLVAVEWEKFYLHQPDPWTRESPEAWAADINADLHAQLWPRTANTRIGATVYELTYYVNPATGPIQAIHPYAAYNITEDRWAVRPDPHPAHPQDMSAPDPDAEATRILLDRYDTAHQHLLAAYRVRPDTPSILNAQTELQIVARDARAMFDEIHGARNEAFSEVGEGYASNENYRWQRAKQSGVINALQMMSTLGVLPAAIGAQADTDLLIHRTLRDRP